LYPSRVSSSAIVSCEEFNAVVTFEIALKILALTSETAEQNLKGPRRPGTRWIVIVGGGGNSYALVPVEAG